MLQKLTEQGIGAFWRGNGTNIIRYFPTQAFNFAFKDTIRAMFPKVDKKTEFGKFFACNVAAGGLAGAGSLMIVYPLDYARTRLASDVGGKDKQFNGLADCIKKSVTNGGSRIPLQRNWSQYRRYHPLPLSLLRSLRH